MGCFGSHVTTLIFQTYYFSFLFSTLLISKSYCEHMSFTVSICLHKLKSWTLVPNILVYSPQEYEIFQVQLHCLMIMRFDAPAFRPSLFFSNVCNSNLIKLSPFSDSGPMNKHGENPHPLSHSPIDRTLDYGKHDLPYNHSI